MKLQQIKKKQEGFTIIEVLIVLAIAALIMLIVFLAIPQLRKSQQNSQIRSEASRILTAATEYEANNNGTQISDNAGAGSAWTTAKAGTSFKQLTVQTVFNTAVASQGASNLVTGTCSNSAATYAAGVRTYALEFILADGTTHACIQS